MKKKYTFHFSLLTLALCFLCSHGFSQNAKSLVKKGDKYLNKENFHQALEYYQQAVARDASNANAHLGLGIANLLLFSNPESLTEIQKAHQLDAKVDEHYYYWLGRAYHANMKFDSAVTAYRVYLNDEIGRNDQRQEAVKTLILQAEFGKTFISSPVDYQITNLGSEINTKYSEHSPVLSSDKQSLYFTSRRLTDPKTTTARGDGWENIYTATGKGKNWSGVSLLPGNVNNPKIHTSTIQLYGNDKQMLVYKSTRFGSIFETKNEGSSWSSPKPFAKFTNTERFEPDGFIISDKSVLYFASSRENKNGNLDLWVARRDEKDSTKWGEPERLPDLVNTDADEDAPFLAPDGLTLYFASRGHDSMGGYDIYKTVYEPFTRTWSKPVNMGFPINTPGDDIYFVTDSTGNKGYLTSNRQNTLGQEDIFLVKEYEEVIVKGKVKVKTSGRPLPDLIVNFDSQRKLGVKGNAITTAEGDYSMQIRSGHMYTVEIKKQTGEVVLTEDYEIPLAEDEGSTLAKDFEVDIPDTIRTTSGATFVVQNLNLMRVRYVETDSLFINGDVQAAEAPLAGATVQIREEDSIKPLYSTVTDANGKYSFAFIPGQKVDYVVDITKDQFLPYTVVLNYPGDGKINKYVTEEDLNSVTMNRISLRSVMVDAFPIDNRVGAKAVLGGVYFDFNSANLHPESNIVLDRLASFLKRNPRIHMEIGGHTDNLGSAYVNKFLSQKRAQSVVAYLVKKGVSKNRLSAVGYGFSEPITTNEHELNGRDINRRVEVKILRK